MKITKAVITAAGRGTRLFPAADTVQKAMLPFIDRDGLSKPLIQIIAEEALASGVEEICIVCAPGDREKYLGQFRELRKNLLKEFKETDWALEEAEKIDDLVNRLQFVAQEEPLGYGHAVSCASSFVGNNPFLLLLGDHLYISHNSEKSCARQILEIAEAENCCVSSVNSIREYLIRDYGTLTGKRLGEVGLYRVEKIKEKPSISTAELELQTPGLRAGFYLCFFGMHVLMPKIFELLKQNFSDKSHSDPFGLTPALDTCARQEKYLALEVRGARYDISSKWGMLKAQIALGLKGREKDAVLSAITEILAENRTQP